DALLDVVLVVLLAALYGELSNTLRSSNGRSV
ncbi:hypothetical protein Tco_0035956, partial [Tanacetum coccineum]